MKRSDSWDSPRTDRAIRVLLVAPSLEILGGQSVQARRLLALLSGEPLIKIAFMPINPRLPGPLHALQKIKYLRTVVTSLAYGAGLLAAAPRCDLVHVFSASYFSFVLATTPAIVIGRLFGKRVLLNYHSGEAPDHLQRWRHTVHPIIRMADGIAVPSQYLVDVFAGFDFNAVAIANLAGAGTYKNRTGQPLQPVFLSNRNLEPLYNVGCTLRAFALIQQRFPEASLTVAGDGNERASLVRLADELNLRNVNFTGQVHPDQMSDLYDQADIYLNSPNIDNMPLSVLEAFASGLPVVTTNAGGIPHLVTHGETGLMVPCNDHRALAAEAVRLLEDPALAAKIATSARHRSERYQPSAVKDDWLRLYRSLMMGQQPVLAREP
jgi:glycosyltransferase involved in cell wall biosynthesis